MCKKHVSNSNKSIFGQLSKWFVEQYVFGMILHSTKINSKSTFQEMVKFGFQQLASSVMIQLNMFNVNSSENRNDKAKH